MGSHQKEDDGVFKDPCRYLLPKLLSSKQILADGFAFFLKKSYFLKSQCYRSNTQSLTIQMIQKGLN